MAEIALVSGLGALVAGVTKYAIDSYKARHSAPNIRVSIGDETIQFPSSYTPEQVAALVSVLKDKAATGEGGISSTD